MTLQAKSGVALVLFALTMQSANSQNPEQCATFNALADKHDQRAQTYLKSIEADIKDLDPATVARLVEEKTKTASSESELSSLAREAYRKCLTDYLQGGNSAANPQPASPLQQALPAPQAPQAQPAPQARPAPRAPAKKGRPVQQVRSPQQQVQQPERPQYQQEAPIFFQPGRLIELGIGIGIGRALGGDKQ